MHHLFVSRAGDSLVNVTQNRNTYRLLANFDGTNVILLQIDAGSVVWLTPDPERPVYLEYYTLLTGELTLHTDEGEAQTLRAGDSFYTTGLDHDISITPKTDVRLLCFTSKPVFDDFMVFVNDLNDLNTQIDRKDHYTYHHSRRVMRFAEAVCQRLSMSPEATHALLLAALYHDDGKCSQQTVKFIRPGVADARLDGDGERRPGEDPVQQPLERGHIRQQPRALALGRHRAGGAAEVQVHLVIAHVAERLRRPEEERRILAEKLGHAEAVFRRKDGKVARGEREILRRADERDEVFGHARKAVAVHPAENRVRYALQRRKIDRHRFSSTPRRQI